MNRGAIHPKLTHLREPKDGTDFWVGQNIAKWDLVIEENKTAAFLVM